MIGQTAIATGHFGELMQGRMGPDGPVALVTLPCPAMRTQALRRNAPGLRLHRTAASPVTPAQLRDLARALGVSAHGHFTLSSNMPLGGGAGASTAALTALAKTLSPHASAAAIARACLSVEGASDPIMFARPEQRLWASRRAQTLATLPALPRMEVVGGFSRHAQRTRPTDMAFPDISDLIAPYTQACETGDLAKVAQIATASARRCLDLRGPTTDPTEALIHQTGALGMVIAHTGSARGLIFAPGTVPDGIRATLHKAGLQGLICFKAGGAQ